MAAIPRYSRRYAAPRLGPVERWFIPALVLTVALHFGGYYLLHVTRFSGFAVPRDTRPPSRVFKIKQATIDPKTLDDHKETPQQAGDQARARRDGNPDSRRRHQTQLRENHAGTARTVIAAPEADKTMVARKSRKVDASQDARTKSSPTTTTPRQMPSDMKALTDQLLNGKPNVTGSHPSFDVTGNTTSSQAQRRPQRRHAQLQQPRQPALRQRGR